MDWKGLFLTSHGRLGQRDFWIAWLILFVASLVLSMVPLLGQLAVLALIYPTVCITAKRLHDFGKSGWLAAVPYAIAAVGMLIGGLMGGMTMMLGGMAGHGAAS